MSPEAPPAQMDKGNAPVLGDTVSVAADESLAAADTEASHPGAATAPVEPLSGIGHPGDAAALAEPRLEDGPSVPDSDTPVPDAAAGLGAMEASRWRPSGSSILELLRRSSHARWRMSLPLSACTPGRGAVPGPPLHRQHPIPRWSHPWLLRFRGYQGSANLWTSFFPNQ